MKAIRWFGAGLACAFIGAVVGFFLGQRVLHHLNEALKNFTIIEMAEARLATIDPRGELPDDNPHQANIDKALAEATEVSQRLTATRGLVWIPFVLYGASIVCFAIGAATPASSLAALRACAGAG